MKHLWCKIQCQQKCVKFVRQQGMWLFWLLDSANFPSITVYHFKKVLVYCFTALRQPFKQRMSPRWKNSSKMKCLYWSKTFVLRQVFKKILFAITKEHIFVGNKMQHCPQSLNKAENNLLHIVNVSEIFHLINFS